ncbi:YkgJ family cysteine cluster protein [Carboxylicivirga sp. N1Y90]|uniref:YkgJ family cysteine cluster protein n=1 Tax=Carboxylicivirga fragile TaxID=3417571 RepID=UPI003D3274E2|nr:YkgJ family cysteine cluster protein [Marinilabiliaceae bacterium N1Y90]
MECRENCGACCIVPSISSAIPGLPNGKVAGERCIHLQDDYCCAIFTHPERPLVCAGFKAEKLFCGSKQSDAFKILSDLEGIEVVPGI